jgi:hypothetical protein
VRWHSSIIPALGGLRQEHFKLKASPSYIVRRPSLLKKSVEVGLRVQVIGTVFAQHEQGPGSVPSTTLTHTCTHTHARTRARAHTYTHTHVWKTHRGSRHWDTEANYPHWVFPLLLLLCWVGDTVAFTKVFTMYQIRHTWIYTPHPLFYPPPHTLDLTSIVRWLLLFSAKFRVVCYDLEVVCV